MGSINRATLAISENLRNNCSKTELAEIEAWVRRYHEVHELKRRHAALTLPEQMASAMEWFKAADADEARQLTDDVLTASTALRKVLNKRGLL